MYDYTQPVSGIGPDNELYLTPAEKKLLKKIDKRRKQREYWSAKSRDEETERAASQITSMMDYITGNPPFSGFINRLSPTSEEKYVDLVLRGMINYMTSNPDAKSSAKDIVEYSKTVGKELADLMANE